MRDYIMNLQPSTINISENYCEWCYGIGNIKCPNGCSNVYYCSEDHQLLHWSIHKIICKKENSSERELGVSSRNAVGDFSDNFYSFDSWCENSAVNKTRADLFNVAGCAAGYEVLPTETHEKIDFSLPMEEEIICSLNNGLLGPENFWDVSDVTKCQNVDFNYCMAKSDVIQNGNKDSTQEHEPELQLSTDRSFEKSSSYLKDICTNIVHDLNMFGICVIDKFIGSKFGDLITDEVKTIHSKGIFQKGQLINANASVPQETVRNDIITWVNGTEPNCNNIGYLIRTLDSVVTTCNRMKDNGILSMYKLHRRTKAMIACYPGDGTYYKKHIDNPNGDGRCVTCIYYLNKNWDTKVHGGLLRMFPSIHNNQVANIEPIFDRMLFFWSDKRNPHEVLPSYATRYAITVWYFDADERDQAILNSKSQRYE